MHNTLRIEAFASRDAQGLTQFAPSYIFVLGVIVGRGRAMFKLFFAIAGVAIFLTAGCTTVPQVAYNRATANIQSVAIIDPVFPKRIAAGELSGDASMVGGMAGGFLGALVFGGIEAAAYENRQKKLDALNANAFDGKALFTALLMDEILARGYGSLIVPDPKPKRIMFVRRLETIDSFGAEALLDVVVSTHGFQKVKNAWAPIMVTNVKMTRTNDELVLFQNVIAYNAGPQVNKAIDITPVNVPTWKDLDAIAADEAAAIDSMRNAIERTVAEIAYQLR